MCQSPKEAKTLCGPTYMSGQQANLEHAEACAALCHLWLSLLEDSEGVDLQAWLWQGGT